ncbi:TRAP transporter substrate-binding protein DctP [Labrenzia sp. PHM005]|uniref:TRAP transporter substrate-binding protein DctP n=1 Tax=Labrenzia sp. PHM005 TaxID=2590016 RepID=UPI001FFCB566|nr:TRAP transporter substrate-binding protein DctP [Labrenzia sp. PHM005]
MFRFAILALFLASSANAQERITITHPSPESSHFGAAAKAFEAFVEAETGGRYDVVLQRLDNEREALETVQLGAQEFGITTTGPAGNFVPEVRVFDIPFLFRDRAHAHAVLDGQVGQDVLAHFSKAGLIGLAWGENGFRHLTTGAAAVSSPADLEGLKIRTMENPLHIAAWRSVGVLPTPISFSELPTALQQGTVDGQENPIPVILSNNFDQLQGNLYLTGHVYSPAIVTGFPGFLEGLSDEDRAIFEEAARVAAAANRERVTADEAAGIDELVGRGMNVVQVNSADYQAAMASAMAEFETQFGAETLATIAAQ